MGQNYQPYPAAGQGFAPASQPPGGAGFTPTSLSPGVDPRMQRAAQQALANPDVGDMVDVFPTPDNMLIGAGAGIGTAGVLYTLMHRTGEQNRFQGLLLDGIRWMDGKPPFTWVNHRLENQVLPYLAKKSDRLKELLMTEIASGKTPEEAVANTLRHAQQMHMRRNIDALKARLNKPEGQKVYQELTQTLRKHPQRWVSDLTARQAQIAELSAKVLQAQGAEKRSLELALKLAQMPPAARKLNLLGDSAKLASFEHTYQHAEYLNHALNRQIAQKAARKTPITAARQKLAIVLRGFRSHVHGLDAHYLSSYKAQAELLAQLHKDGVGPIGRWMAGSFHNLQRIFSGDTMKIGGGAIEQTVAEATEKVQRGVLGEIKGFFGKIGKSMVNRGLFMPAAAGAFIFGNSIQKGRKAEPGEKFKAFFHDFLGTGLGQFVGWELGRKTLNALGARRLLCTFAAKRFLWIPFLSVGGVTVELISMFLIGGLFQKMGEKISHLLFGKPSEKTLNGGKPAVPALGLSGFPALPGTGMAMPGTMPGLVPSAGASQYGGAATLPSVPAPAIPWPALQTSGVRLLPPVTNRQLRGQ